MSIINQMVQDRQRADIDPILSSMPVKKNRKKDILLLLIFLLLISSLTLLYLIVKQDKEKTEKPVSTVIVSLASDKSIKQVTDQTVEKIVAEPIHTKVTFKKVKTEKIMVTEKIVNPDAQKKTSKAPVKKEPAKKILVEKRPVKKESKQKTAQSSNNSYLEIKKLQLTDLELATLYLKAARKAEYQGDMELAVQKREQALAHVATLNEVRKSLALYYYEIGSKNRANTLLRKGVLVSPEYSDFNLMLSRIALKAGDQQKAYLYLNHNPPKVEGNLDYYVSFAILAQKFHKYEQSESLYEALLLQQPDNGRWRMSLAIALDKQQKTDLAMTHYQQALLQTDLSVKAKKYINQRLAYLTK